MISLILSVQPVFWCFPLLQNIQPVWMQNKALCSALGTAAKKTHSPVWPEIHRQTHRMQNEGEFRETKAFSHMNSLTGSDCRNPSHTCTSTTYKIVSQYYFK